MSTEILQPPKLGVARMLLLGASSVVLCLSYLMAMFTPFPLAMATVLYGRLRGYGLMLAGFSICVALGALGVLDYSLAASYAILSVYSLVIAETMKQGWRPVRSLVITGFIFLALIAGGVAAYVKSQQKTLTAVVEGEVSRVLVTLEEAKKAGTFSQDLATLGLDRSALDIATEMLKVVPGYLIMGVFFVLWVNTYLVLKGRRLLQPALKHEFDERTLLNFKVPFAGVYLVVAGLVLAVWGEQIDPTWASPVGTTLLQAIGVFYFFQGFGVALEFLNHFGIVGFFRTVFVMLVVFFVPWLLAALGLFDTWFDFNNKFKKQVSN